MCGMAEDAEKSVEASGEAAGEQTKRLPPSKQAMKDYRETGVVPEGWDLDASGKFMRKKPPDVVDPATTSFDWLMAMRFVVLNPAACDQTPGHKLCREWLEKRPADFAARLQELEREAKGEREGGGDRAVTPTESDRETRALIDELLERHRGRAES